MFKNVAGQSVTLYAVDASTGKEKTGDAANMVFYVSKDDGTVTAISGNSGVPTEVDSTNAKGTYKIALTQGETNADKLLFSGKSSTSNVVVVPTVIYTVPANFTTTSISGSGKVAATLANTDVSGNLAVDLQTWLGSAPNGLTSGRVDAIANAFGAGSLTSAAFGAGAINAAALNADTGFVVRSNTAAAVAAGSITLDASAVATDDYYKDCWVIINSATTGAGQVRRISAYTGSTQVATIRPNWAVTPTGTVKFTIIPVGRTDLDAILGTNSVGAAGYMGIDWSAINAPTSTANLSGTTVGTVTTVTNVSGGVTVATNNDKTGYSLTQAFPSNFASMVISAAGRVDVGFVSGTSQTARDIGASVLLSSGTGAGQISLSSGTVTVGTNNDKTGYALTQSFPANFASLAITVGGAVTVGTNNDKTAYSLTQSFPTNFAALGISVGGHISNVDTLTTYTGNTPQTGDSYARLGAPVGASISADIAGIPNAIFDQTNGIEVGWTPRMSFRVMLSALVGKVSGADVNAPVFRDVLDTKNRIVATTDANGNRSAVTLNGS